MMGFTEDLLNSVVREIERTWESKGRNLSYFVGMVKGSRLSPEVLNTYLAEHNESCHEGVNNVFAAIVYQDFLKKEKGGEK